MSEPTYVEEIDAIKQVVQHYLDGARTGSGAAMKPTFHDDATIYGYVGPDLFGGPIQSLYDWNDENGAAAEVQARFSSIDIVGTCASVRLDTDNWTGHRFTDFLNLVKFDGEWKVVSKVFYLHP
ncbi:MAG: nuclear transport factor 2 family protein [Gammaproteobacteria bacterium]|nr:nuclear transport factor 2 family protein [Gammaproteobacteria bacterium]